MISPKRAPSVGSCQSDPAVCFASDHPKLHVTNALSAASPFKTQSNEAAMVLHVLLAGAMAVPGAAPGAIGPSHGARRLIVIAPKTGASSHHGPATFTNTFSASFSSTNSRIISA